VLVAALVLAVLYFALMELMMMDASRSLNEAQRFRARVVADTLAENGAELAAAQMVSRTSSLTPSYQDDQGLMKGTYYQTGCNELDCGYVLTGEGRADGVIQQKATVRLQGRITKKNEVLIDYATHSQ
jgi:hypothetical protein